MADFVKAPAAIALFLNNNLLTLESKILTAQKLVVVMLEIGTVEKIWLKRGKRAPMDVVEQAELIEGKGLKNNANQGGWRQVTLLDATVWERVMANLDAKLDPVVRRANILVRGLDLTQSRGKILQLGDGQLKMLNETKPCERMDEVLPGLKNALYDNWGGGAFGRVIVSGKVWTGAKIYWVEASRK